MTLSKFGECFNLDCHKEAMPFNVYTYETVNTGACSNIFKDEDKQQF